jgi:hypothetical protein
MSVSALPLTARWSPLWSIIAPAEPPGLLEDPEPLTMKLPGVKSVVKLWLKVANGRVKGITTVPLLTSVIVTSKDAWAGDDATSMAMLHSINIVRLETFVFMIILMFMSV